MAVTQNKLESVSAFTIIIPVIHSLEDLKRCLNSLNNLDYPSKHFHVVLVDCGVVPGLKQFFDENLPEFGFQVSTLYLTEQAKGELNWFIESRLNEARNYAMQMVPGRCYVFTEDDCMLEPDWLKKLEATLTDEVGAIGGPDILPEGMGWFPRALDFVLNSYMGTAGMRRGKDHKAALYHPRKENMAIPAWVLDRVGKFSEGILFGGEMEIARRIRDSGLKIVYLPDNPVWHRRVTSFFNFVRVTAYMASEKVRLMREQHTFFRSLHFFVLLVAIAGTLIGLSALVSSYAIILFFVLVGIYLAALIATAATSAFRARSVCVGIGVVLLMPAHHLSLMLGIIKGVITRTKLTKEES